jgi:hypothetical protein
MIYNSEITYLANPCNKLTSVSNVVSQYFVLFSPCRFAVNALTAWLSKRHTGLFLPHVYAQTDNSREECHPDCPETHHVAT